MAEGGHTARISRTEYGIPHILARDPSKGARGERGAWFRDSEGNMLGIGEPVL